MTPTQLTKTLSESFFWTNVHYYSPFFDSKLTNILYCTTSSVGVYMKSSGPAKYFRIRLDARSESARLEMKYQQDGKICWMEISSAEYKNIKTVDVDGLTLLKIGSRLVQV